MKTVKAVVETVETKTESKETSMKTKVNSYFNTLAANNPKLAKAVKAFKSGSVYLVKNYVASVFGIAILPASMQTLSSKLTSCRISGADLTTEILLAWRKEQLPEEIQDFLKMWD